jgi:plastocyanin
MRFTQAAPAALLCSTLFAACGGGSTPSPNTYGTPATALPTLSPSAPATGVPSTAPSVAPSVAPTAQPQQIHVGFNHAETTDPTFGPVYFYSTAASGPAQVIRVAVGSQLVFVNDDPSGVAHTASGFGSGGFPASFDNGSRFTRAGAAVDGGTTWSTGSLSSGQSSQVLTVPAAGTYYFGCGYHYTTVPTSTNGSMGDVLVAS